MLRHWKKGLEHLAIIEYVYEAAPDLIGIHTRGERRGHFLNKSGTAEEE